MTNKLNITILQDPRDFAAEHGEYALVGLYMRTYWESLEIGDAMLEIKTLAPSHPRPAKLLKKLEDYDNWLGIAADLLPEWAVMMLAEIDTALEGDEV